MYSPVFKHSKIIKTKRITGLLGVLIPLVFDLRSRILWERYMSINEVIKRGSSHLKK